VLATMSGTLVPRTTLALPASTMTVMLRSKVNPPRLIALGAGIGATGWVRSPPASDRDHLRAVSITAACSARAKPIRNRAARRG
jgi:hypothetical protein